MIQTLSMMGKRALATIRSFTPGQMAAVVFGILALVAAGILIARLATPAMTPLYSNLSAADATSITQELNTMGVGYELTDGGTQILVAPGDVSTSRLAISAKGLPSASDGGYTLLDKQGITTSEFMQNVTYQRALEGELANTIKAIKGVNSAIVHIAIPADSVFTKNTDKPSASVMVTMSGGQTLDGEQVQAISNLVASSVPGLTTSAVTVTDANGALLSGGGVAGAASTQQQARMETALTASAQAMLDKVLGPGKSTVNVHADLDYDARSTKSQTYAYPSQIPALTNVTASESYSSNGTNGSGSTVVGSPTPVPLPGASSNASSAYQKSSVTQTNAVDSTVTERTGAPGAVRRLTVSVLVDAAVPQATVTQLQALVGNAVGFDQARGDAIQVAQVPFDTSAATAAKAAADAAASADRMTMIFDLVRKLGIGRLVLGVLVMAFIAIRRQRRTLLDLEALEALERERQIGLATLERLDEEGAMDEEALAVNQRPTREAINAELVDFAAAEPEQVARVLQSWMTKG